MGFASPDVRLRVRGVAVTESVRFCGGGIYSVLGFEYGVVITRVTRVRVLLPFLPMSLRFLRVFGFVGVTGCGDPAFLAYPHVFFKCGPFIGFLGFFGVRQSFGCVAVDRQDDYSADSYAQPCTVRLCWQFFFRISRFSR